MEFNMKKNSLTLMIVIALVLLTGIFAVLHLSTRPKVSEGNLLVKLNGQSVTLDINTLSLTDVKGELVNGKGERRTVDAKGIALEDVLTAAGADVALMSSVTVTASDEYNAVVLAEEIRDSGKAFLVLQEDNQLQLVVFGDENSKRNVTNVVRLMVE